MIDDGDAVLVRLTDTGRTVADPTNDIRGRAVLDETGTKLGTVDDLLIDAHGRRVRFLRVVRGGVLGFGVTPCYVPVTAVTHVGDVVHVRMSGDAAPRRAVYDPELISISDHSGSDYRYVFAPYWVPGLRPPPHGPRRRG
jgi:sporulation protein YlmC with PRC-barrel domain